MHDVIVIGGSYAGLSAALQLARARRRVAIVDSGLRRNRFASHSHGFLTQDGVAPDVIATTARDQVLAYPTVTWHAGEATDARADGGGFVVTLGGGTSVAGSRLILAIGVRDELPAIDGLAERWGRSVFHCPYCHGYEVDGPIGVLAASPMSIHHAQMLPDWGPTTYFLNGGPAPTDAELADLARRGTAVEPAPIRRLVGARADIELADGRIVPVSGLFTATRMSPSSPLAETLGCALATTPTGSHIETDPMKQTTVPGVFACGDAARPFGSVALAVGDGAMTGASVHRSLLFPGP
ncbi:MAG: NAD(P)/FAD-dependent oxidoreductase [Devosia sp.]|nr:NAD(P)/FAD-dependent oxidoreductase [Devosia sp.]